MIKLFRTEFGFRRIELGQRTVTIWIGKPGSPGQMRVVSLDTESDARGEFDRIAGFSGDEVPPDLWTPAPPRHAPPVPSQPEPTELLLDRLDVSLARIRPDFHALLNPGATETQIEEAERTIERRFPDALRQLYTWKNGTNDEFSSFLQNWTYVPLNVLVEDWRCTAEMIGYDFERENWFHEGWLPFLSRGNGDHLCVDSFGAFGGPPGQVVEFIHDDPLRPVVSPSLHAWLDALVAAMEDMEPWPPDEDFDPGYEEIIKARHPGYPRDFGAG